MGNSFKNYLANYTPNNLNKNWLAVSVTLKIILTSYITLKCFIQLLLGIIKVWFIIIIYSIFGGCDRD